MKKLILITLILVSFFNISAVAEDAATSPEEDLGIKHEGSIEAGASYATGNTEKENFRGKAELTSSYQKIVNEFSARASNTKENNNRTEELYRISTKPRYEFDEYAYSYAELEYASDRFSGYNSRTSELLGIGAFLIKEELMKLSIEAGAGARQTDFTGNTKDENSILGKSSGEFDWKINKNVHFNQQASISVGKENTVTESETSLKSFIDDNLYLKISYEVEHNSDVPIGTKNTDTNTILTVGYDF